MPRLTSMLLARLRVRRHFNRAMTRWPFQQIIGLVLGLILAIGINLSAIQVNAMTIEMALSSDMVNCNCHGGRNESDPNSVDCLSICNTASQALRAPEPAAERKVGP